MAPRSFFPIFVKLSLLVCLLISIQLLTISTIESPAVSPSSSSSSSSASSSTASSTSSSSSPSTPSRPLGPSRSDPLALSPYSPGRQSGPLITYAVSLTSCDSEAANPGNGNRHDSHLQGLSDGSRVLAHSIALAHENSKYSNYNFVAFVHSSAAESPCAEILSELGFSIKNVPTPVDVAEIQHDNLRESIVKNGCCGEKELIKFYSYTLLGSAVVVHLDIDVLIMKPLDDLFDGIISGAASAYFTKDYNLVNPGKSAGIQGGFFVVKPDSSVFARINEIVLTGTFTGGRGWMDSGVGMFWGGMTFQGLAAYYYEVESTTGVEVSRCEYNNMVDNPKTKEGVCRDGSAGGDCEDCRYVTPSSVHSCHFTICAKPWTCQDYFSDKQALCKDFHTKWFETRRDYEESVGTWDPSRYSGSKYGGFCKGEGAKNYIAIP